MRVAILCKRYYTNQDLILNEFGRYYRIPIILAERDVEALVFCADYKGRNLEKYRLNNVKFISFPLNLMSLFKFLKNFYMEVKNHRSDVLIAGGDSHFGYLGMIVAKLLKIPFVFDVYDYYPAFPSNKLPGMKFLYKQALKNADLVTCVSENLNQHIMVYNNNIIQIKNGIDPDVFYPLDRVRCRALLKISNEEIVIGYFGSMEPMRGLDVLRTACQLLCDKFNIKLRLLLAGNKPESLDLDYDWIDYRGQKTQKEIAVMINASSVVVLPYNDDQQIHYSNSCKIAEYFSCKVPIVSTRVPDFISNYPEEYRLLSGAICEPGDPYSMCDALYYQINNQKILIPQTSLTWSALTDKLLIKLKQL